MKTSPARMRTREQIKLGLRIMHRNNKTLRVLDTLSTPILEFEIN